MHYPTLPEIIRTSRQALLAPVIDASVLVGFEPCVLRIYLCQFRERVASCTDPYIRIMKIMQCFFQRQRNGCLAFIIIKRIDCSCILKKISQIVFSTGYIPCPAEIITGHDSNLIMHYFTVFIRKRSIFFFYGLENGISLWQFPY